MSSQWYLKQLQDPRWKAKRQEVWKRDNYTCQNCGKTGCQVCAHHLRYPKGKKPWECPLDDLATWCIDCHNTFHKQTQINAQSLLDPETVQQLETDGFHADRWESAIVAELENILLQVYLEERDERVAKLEEQGAEWDADGQYYFLGDDIYDADGEMM